MTLTGEQFVTLLYRSLLNRPPEQGAVEGWLKVMAGGKTRSEVLDAFVSSEEFARLHPRHLGHVAFPELAGIEGIFPIRICDVGAMCIDGADHAYQRLLEAAQCEVIGFEPQMAEVEKRAKAEPGCRLLPFVVGDGTPTTFYKCNKPWGSSCYMPDWAFMRTFANLGADARIEAEIATPTRRLDNIEEVRGSHFLKMDIQGGRVRRPCGR